MIRHLKLILGASAVALLATGAQSQTIDFGGLPQSNGSAFTGPYLEDGYTTSATGGQVFEGHVFGNPEPSLVVGNVFGGGNSGTVEITRAAAFRLGSWDQTAQNGVGGYTVEGYLGAALQYTLSGGVVGNAVFQTFAGNSANVNRLVFILTTQGTSTNFDNVVLNAVPEPATWALMILGFGMAGYSVRSRKVSHALA